jgi:hypothetical protein
LCCIGRLIQAYTIDTPITFYARNILAGNGFVYNPGERFRHDNALSPILLALLAAFRGPAPSPTCPAFKCFRRRLHYLLLVDLGRRLGSHRADGSRPGMVVAPFSVTLRRGLGRVYILLLTSTMYAHLWKNIPAACSARCPSDRPDALILLGPLALIVCGKRLELEIGEKGNMGEGRDRLLSCP